MFLSYWHLVYFTQWIAHYNNIIIIIRSVSYIFGLYIIETRDYAVTQFCVHVRFCRSDLKRVKDCCCRSLSKSLLFDSYNSRRRRRFLPRLIPIDFVFGRIIGFYDRIWYIPIYTAVYIRYLPTYTIVIIM